MRLLKAIVIFLVLFLDLNSQDIHFSQFNQAPISMNPANAGIGGLEQRFVMNYRSQWQSITSGFNTYMVSYDSPVKKKKRQKNYLAFGVSAFSDKAGDLNWAKNQMNVSFAYHLSVDDDNVISFGLKGGVLQQSIDPDNTQWDNQYDPNSLGYNSSIGSTESLTNTNSVQGDFAVGMIWTYSSNSSTLSSDDELLIDGGISYNHVNSPKMIFLQGSTERMYKSLRFHGNIRKGIKSTNLQIEPGGYFQIKKSAQELVIGSSLRYRFREESKYTGTVGGVALKVGTHYRLKDAMIFSMLLEMGSFSVGFSYDMNASTLGTNTTGVRGVEIALLYRTPSPFLSRKSSSRFK